LKKLRKNYTKNEVSAFKNLIEYHKKPRSESVHDFAFTNNPQYMINLPKTTKHELGITKPSLNIVDVKKKKKAIKSTSSDLSNNNLYSLLKLKNLNPNCNDAFDYRPESDRHKETKRVVKGKAESVAINNNKSVSAKINKSKIIIFNRIY